MKRRCQVRHGLAVIGIHMMNKKLWKKILIAITTAAAAILCMGALSYILWNNGVFLPRWIQWENRTFCSQSGQYKIVLSHKSVSIISDNTVIWTSPEAIKIQDAISCDMDNDRQDELILLCWKIGRYGNDKPFWVEKDEKKWSQHIFVYEYSNGEIRPKWMSSYIGQDVAVLSENGKSSPFCRLLLTDLEGCVSSWMWDSWGFMKEDTDISFLVFGDNLIHEPIYRYGLRNDTSFGFLYENFQDIISQSDIAIINQETPLTDNPFRYSGYPRFDTPANVGQAIADAGFDAVSCATNHALDQGAEGINFTKKFFDSHNIKCLGIQSEEETAYKPYEIIAKGGIRFAMLNYTYGTNGMKLPESNPNMVHLLDDEQQIRQDIEHARTETDFVLVFVHWGQEYSREIDDLQQKWTQIFMESKADVVIGTHPHTLQPYEVLTDSSGHKMLVYYSIGNFISAQPEESSTKGGMASFTVSLTPAGCEITEFSLEPLTIRRQEDGKYTTALDAVSYKDSGNKIGKP